MIFQANFRQILRYFGISSTKHFSDYVSYDIKRVHLGMLNCHRYQ